jgi:iron complex transport system ATP-binding protein
LSARNISVRYGKRLAVHGFEADVNPGEVVALIGPNGSGKSTALHALAGLNKPYGGEVTIEGRPIARWSRRELAKRLSFLPQAPISPEGMTVEQLAKQGRFAHIGLLSRYSASDSSAVAWALEQTGLVGHADRNLSELSGGERQRAWIAAALAQEASILLLDEPTSFLDIGHQVEVLELLCRLARQRDVAVIIAMHDINQAIAIADRILLMEAGAMRFQGEPDELARSGLIESVFNVRGGFLGRHFEVEIGTFRSSSPPAA